MQFGVTDHIDANGAPPAELLEQRLTSVAVAGLGTMSLHLAFGTIAHEHACRTAELFAAEVMPAFAEAGVRA